MNHEVDALAEQLRASFTRALDMVTAAMKLLVDNGIEPVAQHQKIAFDLGTGKISEEEFVSLARAISSEHADDNR